MSIKDLCVVKFPADISKRSLRQPGYTPPVPLEPPFILMLSDKSAVMIVLSAGEVFLEWEVLIPTFTKHPKAGRRIPLTELFSEVREASRVLELCAMVGEDRVRIVFDRVNPFILGSACTLGERDRFTLSEEKTPEILSVCRGFYSAIRVLETGPQPTITFSGKKSLADMDLLEAERSKAAEASERAAEMWRNLPKPRKLPELRAEDVRFDPANAIKLLAKPKGLKEQITPKRAITTKIMRLLLDAISVAEPVQVHKLWLPEFVEIRSSESLEGIGQCYCCAVKDHRGKIADVWIPAVCVFKLVEMIQKRFGRKAAKIRDRALPYETTIKKLFKWTGEEEEDKKKNK